MNRKVTERSPADERSLRLAKESIAQVGDQHVSPDASLEQIHHLPNFVVVLRGTMSNMLPCVPVGQEFLLCRRCISNFGHR